MTSVSILYLLEMRILQTLILLSVRFQLSSKELSLGSRDIYGEWNHIRKVHFASKVKKRKVTRKILDLRCLNEDLLTISKWLIAKELTLNTTKTEFMPIDLRKKLYTITNSPVVSINGTPVNHVSTSKSLGVLIDGILTWSSHIEKLAKKIPSGIAVIKRVRQFVPPSSNIASYLQSLDLAAFRLLQRCLGKLWRKISRQTSKTSKIVQREI